MDRSQCRFVRSRLVAQPQHTARTRAGTGQPWIVIFAADGVSEPSWGGPACRDTSSKRVECVEVVAAASAVRASARDSRRRAARRRAMAAPRAATGRVGTPGRRCAGRATRADPSAAHAASVVARRTIEQRPQVAAVDRPHAGDRARARAATKTQQHRLGLVVERVPEQHRRRPARPRPRRRVRRSGPPGPRASDTTDVPDPVRQRLDGVEPELGTEGLHPGRLRRGIVAQTVVDGQQPGGHSSCLPRLEGDGCGQRQ